MSSVTVCARFRPLSAKEKRDHGDSICIHRIDSETFNFKDEKDEEVTFSFDRVFYAKSEQADVYEFLALPIVQDAVNAVNGTIITYGQTGAGKTYSMEGPDILESNDLDRGILPRVVNGIFECIKSYDDASKHSIKLSMVEIYMEKVRDLFDLSKDNIRIKENKAQGIMLSGVTEISLMDPAEAFQSLSSGLANRAVGETQMNVASSRSHCIYIFTIHQYLTREKREKAGKLVLVDLAGSEKVEKTGAEGRLLEEAKTINKSLSALGNVISALTCSPRGRANHIPYRDSKLTRILQDALGGNTRTALLCCCSLSLSNASETLSTLRFGARAKHIKAAPIPRVSSNGDKFSKKNDVYSPIKDESYEKIIEEVKNDVYSPIKDESYEKIIEELGQKLNERDVQLLEQLLIREGIFFDPCSIEEVESVYEDLTLQTISTLQQALEELLQTNGKLKEENEALKDRVAAAERLAELHKEKVDTSFLHRILGIPSFFVSRIRTG